MKKVALLISLCFLYSSCNKNIVHEHDKLNKKFQNRLAKHRKGIKVGVSRTGSHVKPGSIRPLTTFPQLADWIYSYVYSNFKYDPTHFYPQYFIMKTDGLVNLLNPNTHTAPKYLHFYLSTNEMTNNLDLTIIGAIDDNTGDVYNYIHSPKNTVFGGLTSSYETGVLADDFLEGKYRNPGGQWTQYHSYLNVKLPAQTIPIERSLAQNRILNYQTNNQFQYEYSFLVNCEEFYDFLTNIAHQEPQDTHLPQITTVPYLQIYLAYVNGDVSQPTVIIVGLDSTGKHIYFTPDGQNDYVFEAAVPCPYCGVQYDDGLDGNVPQNIHNHR